MDGSDFPDLPRYWGDFMSLVQVDKFPRIFELLSSEDTGLAKASEFFECAIEGLQDAPMTLATKLVSAMILYINQAAADSSNIISAFRERLPHIMRSILQVGRAPDDRFADGISQLIKPAVCERGMLLRSPAAIVSGLQCAAAIALACTTTSPITCTAGAVKCAHIRLLTRAALICIGGLTRIHQELPAGLSLVETSMDDAFSTGGSSGLQWGGLLLGLLGEDVTASLIADWDPDFRPVAQSIRTQVISYLRRVVPALKGFRGEAFRSNHVVEIERMRSQLTALRTTGSRDIAAGSASDGTVQADKFASLAVCRCGSKATFYCGGCNLVAYCGRECQRYAWKAGHKGECKKR